MEAQIIKGHGSGDPPAVDAQDIGQQPVPLQNLIVPSFRRSDAPTDGQRWGAAAAAVSLSAAFLGNEMVMPPRVEAAPVINRASVTDEQTRLEELLAGDSDAAILSQDAAAQTHPMRIE